MTFLLIDFGASFIKSIVYHRESDSFDNLRIIQSPFINTDKLSKDEILVIIQNILADYKSVDGVVMCSILGGYYVENIYYSWKCSVKPNKPIDDNCLLSELFKGQPSYHVHANHSKKSEVKGLKLLDLFSIER